MTETSSTPPVTSRRNFLKGSFLAAGAAAVATVAQPEQAPPVVSQAEQGFSPHDLQRAGTDLFKNALASVNADNKQQTDLSAVAGAAALLPQRNKLETVPLVYPEEQSSPFDLEIDPKYLEEYTNSVEISADEEEQPYSLRKKLQEKAKYHAERRKEEQKTRRARLGEKFTSRRWWFKTTAKTAAAVGLAASGVYGLSKTEYWEPAKQKVIEFIRHSQIRKVEYDDDEKMGGAVGPVSPEMRLAAATVLPVSTARESLTDIASIQASTDRQEPTATEAIPTASPSAVPTESPTSTPPPTETLPPTVEPTPEPTATQTVEEVMQEVGDMHLGEYLFSELVREIRTKRYLRAGIDPNTGTLLPVNISTEGWTPEQVDAWRTQQEDEKAYRARMNPDLTKDPDTKLEEIKRVLDDPTINMLVIGTDAARTNDGVNNGIRNDVNLLVRTDPVTGAGTIITAPRDTLIPRYGVKLSELNERVGRNMSEIRVVEEEMFGRSIDGAIQVDIQGTVNILDRLFPAVKDEAGNIVSGGLLVDAERIDDPAFPTGEKHPENGGDLVEHLVIEAGLKRLDAVNLVKYARSRHNAGGDLGRQRRQAQVLEAAIKELLPDRQGDENVAEQVTLAIEMLWKTNDTLATLLSVIEEQKQAGHVEELDQGVAGSYILQRVKDTLVGSIVNPIMWAKMGVIAQNSITFAREIKAKENAFRMEGMGDLLYAVTETPSGIPWYRFILNGQNGNDTSLNYWTLMRQRVADVTK